ncbi:hypothetical protein [Novosphingobium sp. 32-60-15]|uniref:hypothetical protein n=1 Tax=Novosphingobium sp. 32-60-15 TaxID=1970410 RepID=UPI002601360C|nr:hypothetical protein [Novosphingobium sp. 32-60-15]
MAQYLACTSIFTDKALPMTGSVFAAASVLSPARFYPIHTYGAESKLSPTKFHPGNGFGPSRLEQYRPKIG